MALQRIAFGTTVTDAHLKAAGLDLEFTPKSELTLGNTYEAPCQIKTSLRDILAFGAFSYINGRGRFTHVRIGRYCSIAEGVAVGYPEHPIDWLSTSPVQYMRPGWAGAVGDWKRTKHVTTKETEFGNDVWIGAGVFIRTGVTIGTGAVIGAHAVVTKDVPPYSVVVGNPGRIIKTRVPGDLIEPLLTSRWWEFSPVQLSGCPFNDPKASLKFIQKLRLDGTSPFKPKKLVITLNGAEIMD
jgi:acetyltransferase-like isoleucine patch superfamily enzyme